MEKGINKKDLIYEGKKNNFQQFETIWAFGDNIFHVKINIAKADAKRSNLLNIILKFNDIDKTKIKSDKKKKKEILVWMLFMKVKKYFLMLLKVKYFN